MAFLREIYPGIDLAPRQDSFSLWVTGAGDERFACMAEGLTSSGHLRTAPHPSLVVLETMNGVYESMNERQAVDVRRPSLGRQRRGEAHWDHTFSVYATHVDPRSLDELASEHFALPGLHVRFTDVAPMTRANDVSWAKTTAFVRNLLETDDLLDNAIVRDSAFTLLASRMLVTFSNNTLDFQDARDGAKAVPASLRRAITFMEEHIAESIQLVDIARASRLSPRGLQDAFLRILGTTPTQYLRRTRLDAAHSDLKAADPSHGVTVESVARRWGFVHMARFAARYRAEYGEYPATTLRS